MLAILEVLMAKAISYTWASVRGFYSYLARQVELRRLDWDRITEIRDMASTFFKHSDLRSTHSRNLNSSASSSPSSGSSSQELTAKGCQAWNYKGSCSCDSTASNYASHHLCRVCKSSEHPMLHCPKQKMPIPNQQWLDSQTIGLTVYTDYDTDSDTRTEHHMLSNKNFSQPIHRARLSLIFSPRSLRNRMPTEPKYPFLRNWTFLFGGIICQIMSTTSLLISCNSVGL